MNLNDILKILESHKTEKTDSGLTKTGQKKKLQRWGISLSKLKEIGKQIGSNHKLASELWDTLIYDALVLSTMIENPKEVTREQVDKQVKDVDLWQLSSLFSHMVGKTNFAHEKAEEWTSSSEETQRRCGYTLLCHIARDDKKIEDAFFENYLQNIKDKIKEEESTVKEAMNNAILMIGQRNENLNRKAIHVASQMESIHVDNAEAGGEPIDVLKFLKSKKVKDSFKKPEDEEW